MNACDAFSLDVSFLHHNQGDEYPKDKTKNMGPVVHPGENTQEEQKEQDDAIGCKVEPETTVFLRFILIGILVDNDFVENVYIHTRQQTKLCPRGTNLQITNTILLDH